MYEIHYFFLLRKPSSYLFHKSLDSVMVTWNKLTKWQQIISGLLCAHIRAVCVWKYQWSKGQNSACNNSFWFGLLILSKFGDYIENVFVFWNNCHVHYLKTICWSWVNNYNRIEIALSVRPSEILLSGAAFVDIWHTCSLYTVVVHLWQFFFLKDVWCHNLVHPLADFIETWINDHYIM